MFAVRWRIKPVLHLLSVWAVLIGLLAVGPAMAVGAWRLSRWARRRSARIERARRFAAHLAPVGSARSGPCTVEGRWQSIAPGRAVVSDQHAAIVVEYDRGLTFGDSERRFVFGYVDGLVDDPRAVDFHQPARLPRLVLGPYSGVADDLSGAASSDVPVLAAHLGVIILGGLGVYITGYVAFCALFVIGMSNMGMAR